MKNKTTKDRDSDYINLRDLTENASKVVPAFNPNIASHKDKEGQWIYYFSQHIKEITEVLKGAEDVLCVHLTWMQEYMPTFAEAMQSDDLTAGSYISIGNKTLQRLQLEGYEPQKDAHIRFSDSQSIDAIAKDVRTAEIAPKKPKKKERKKGKEEEKLSLADVLDLPDYENTDEITNIIVLKKSVGGLQQDFYVSAKLVNGELEFKLMDYKDIPTQTAPSLDFHKQDYVSFCEVYNELYHTLKDYAAFGEGSIYPKLIALGSIASYFREVFYTYPYFDYISSEPEAGKTTAMKVQTFLSFYGTIASSITEALLFREIDGSHCFYGLDNIERLFAAPKDYISIIDWLLSSYSKDIPCKRLEKTEEDYKVRYFDGYGIKAFTHIKDFPYSLRALRSRCIQIVMETKRPRCFYPSADKFSELRDKLYKARLYEFEAVKKSYQERIDSNSLTGRTGDLYYPLLSIAKLVDKELYEIVLKYARTDEGDRKELDLWNKTLIMVLASENILGSRSAKEIAPVLEDALRTEGLLKDSERLYTKTVTKRLKKLGFEREEKKTDNKTWFLIDEYKLMSKAYAYGIITENEYEDYKKKYAKKEGFEYEQNKEKCDIPTESEVKHGYVHTTPKPNFPNLFNLSDSNTDKEKTKEGSTENNEEDKTSGEALASESGGSDEELDKLYLYSSPQTKLIDEQFFEFRVDIFCL